jgi:hypothetical protein
LQLAQARRAHASRGDQVAHTVPNTKPSRSRLRPCLEKHHHPRHPPVLAQHVLFPLYTALDVVLTWLSSSTRQTDTTARRPRFPMQRPAISYLPRTPHHVLMIQHRHHRPMAGSGRAPPISSYPVQPTSLPLAHERGSQWACATLFKPQPRPATLALPPPSAPTPQTSPGQRRRPSLSAAPALVADSTSGQGRLPSPCPTTSFALRPSRRASQRPI